MKLVQGVLCAGLAAGALAGALACGGTMGPADGGLPPSAPPEGYAWAVAADASPASVQPYVFQPGTPLYAARADVDVFRAPGDPAGATRLAFREVVTVREAGEPVVFNGIRGVWYGVEYRTDKGFVFSADVTPITGAWSPEMGPMDDPARAWGWTVSFGPDLAPVFRTQAPEGAEVVLPLRITERFRGGRLEATMADWGDMAHEVQITQCDLQERQDGPACTTAKVRWSPDARTVAQVTAADAWQFEPETLMEPTCGAGDTVLAVTPTTPEVLFQVQLPTYLRAPDGKMTCSRVGTASGADLAGDLVMCGRAGGDKTSPSTWDVLYYVANGDVWTYLPCAGTPGTEGDANPALADRGRKLRVRDRITLPPAARGALEAPNLKLVRRIPKAANLNLKSAGTDPVLGPVWIAADPDSNRDTAGGILVDDGSGGLLVYAWKPTSTDITWTSPGAPEGRSWEPETIGCDGQIQWATNVEMDVAWDTLTPVGTLAGGAPVAALADLNHPANQRLREAHSLVGELPADTHGVYPVGVSFEGLIGSLAWVYVQDPWGRIVRLSRDDLKLPPMCEPILYVYADPPTPVRIEPAGTLQFFRSWPETYDGWTAVGQPDGTVWVDGRPYEDLFWEGRSGYFAEPTRGWVVDGAEVPALLREVLPAWGLQPREVDAMVEAWGPRLADKGKVRLGLFGTEAVNELAPLRFDPAPDTLIRVMLDARAASPGETARAPEAPEPFNRRGLVIVEWGGVWR